MPGSFNVGDKVTVLAPFSDVFPETYTVESTDALIGGTAVHLVGVESAFDPMYLEAAQ